MFMFEEMLRSDSDTSSVGKNTCNKCFCGIFGMNKTSGFVTSKYPDSGRKDF